MSDGHYRIVFVGETLPDQEIAEVKANVNKMLKLDAEKTARLFCGRAVVLKKGVDQETAEKYRAAFHKAGAIVRVEAMQIEEQSRPRPEGKMAGVPRASKVQKHTLEPHSPLPQSHEPIFNGIDTERRKSMDIPAVLVFLAVLSVLFAATCYMMWPALKAQSAKKETGAHTARAQPDPQKETQTALPPNSQKSPAVSSSGTPQKGWTVSKADYLLVKRLKREGLDCLRRGEYSKAEPLYRKRFQIMLEKGGQNYPALPAAMNDLADVLSKQGRFEEAETLYLEAIKTCKERGNGEDLGVAVASEGLAEIYLKKGKLHEVEPLYRRAIGIWDKMRGPDNGNTLALKRRLADLMEKLGRKEEAAQLQEHIRRLRKRDTAEPRYTKHNSALSKEPRKTEPSSHGKAFANKTIEKAVRIPVSLSRDFFPVGMTVAARGSGQSKPLSDTRPGDILKEPRYDGKNQKYGMLVLGTHEDKSYYYAFDLIDAPHPVLYFDRNRNRDLTDDGPPLKNQGSGIFATTIALPIHRLIKELDNEEDFRIWFFTNDAMWHRGFTRHYSRTQLKGSININDKTYLAFIAEAGVNDADFTNDGIYLDLDSNGKIDYRKEFVGNRQMAQIDGKQYWFDIHWKSP